MPTKRGWSAFATGISLWVASRFAGSPNLHMLGVGLLILPILSLLVVRVTKVRISVARTLSGTRVFAGTRVTVNLVVQNEGRSTISFLLLEDLLPHSFGKPARLVVTGVPPHNKQAISYSIVCRNRGRYKVGPLSIFVTDPFGLSRVRVETTAENELIVYPAIEDLPAWRLAAQGSGSGEAAVRFLHRAAAEFYTMRQYVTGDDLRRIHWPSVARTGQLMIRQDESTRRSRAVLFLDNRSAALGGNGSVGFERAISATASIGRLLSRAGYAVSLATADSPIRPVTETSLLDFLAGTGPARARGIADALAVVRSAGQIEGTLGVVAALPTPAEIAALSRVGTGYARKLAVLIYPLNTTTLPAPAAQEYETRATAARISLLRSGWDVYLIQPDGKLADAWQSRNRRRTPLAVSSS
jgi:uncharacterized protein (DUF58 family)